METTFAGVFPSFLAPETKFSGNNRIDTDDDPSPLSGNHRPNVGFNRICLALNLPQRAECYCDAADANANKRNIGPKSGAIISILLGGRDDPYVGCNVLIAFALEAWAVSLLYSNRRRWKGWLILFGCLLCFARLGVSLHREDQEREREYQQIFQHNIEIVPQKHIDIL